MRLEYDSLSVVRMNPLLGVKCYRMQNVDYKAIITESSDSFSIISLSNKQVHKYPIPIRNSTARAFELLPNSLIALLYSNEFVVADWNGEVLYQFEFENPCEIDGDTTYLLSDLNPELLYDTSNKTYFVSHNTMTKNFVNADFYKSSIESVLNEYSKKFNSLPISFPVWFQKNFYGFTLSYHRVLNNNNELIYSFPATGELSIFNLNTKSTHSIDVSSTHHLRPILGLDSISSNDLSQSFLRDIVCDVYGRILYDPYRKLYFRFFYQGVSEQNDSGAFNGLKDKPSYLMVIDSTFKLQAEFELPKNTITKFAFVGKRGLYIPIRPEYKYDADQFSYYNIYTFN